MHGAFSPEGKWIAVDALEGGSRRLEVRPFPGPGSRIPVTAMGASYARWRGDGRELCFISRVDGSPAIMAAAVTWNGGVPDFGAGHPSIEGASRATDALREALDGSVAPILKPVGELPDSRLKKRAK